MRHQYRGVHRQESVKCDLFWCVCCPHQPIFTVAAPNGMQAVSHHLTGEEEREEEKERKGQVTEKDRGGGSCSVCVCECV